MKTILWGLFCALGARSVAQIIRPAAYNSVQAATYDQSFRDIFSSKLNPAALATQPYLEAGAFVEKKFLLRELRQYSIIAAAPVANGGWGFSMDHAGLPGFSHWQSSLGYGIHLGKLSLGAQLNYLVQQARGYGNNGYWSVSLGTLWKPSPAITTGFCVQQLSGSIFSRRAASRLAYAYSAGMGIQAGSAVLLEATLSKQEAQSPSVLAAIHYRADCRLMASLFYDLKEAMPSIRMKWLNGWLQLGVTGSYHALLGFTPGILLITSPAKKEAK